jgi:signal transduction histidine kinase
MAGTAIQSPDGNRDHVVLVLAPTGRDMPLTCAMLTERAAIACEPCANLADLCERVKRGAGAALIAQEAIDIHGARRLIECLSSQFPWSDLPVIVLSKSLDDDISEGSVLATLRRRGNVTVLERPVRIVTLISSVQSALRARRRQYEVRDLLSETRNAVRQRDQFLAMLGHELRNPLAAITHAMGVLDMASPSHDPIETDQRDIIRRQTEHLARLVDDLLDVSRITSGKIVLQPRTIDLCELVTSSAHAIEASATANRHQLNVMTPAEAIRVWADPVRLEQVINNLLTNAIKYTPAGGLIEVSVTAEGGEAILRVRDNGIGIPRELLPRVFELFTQAEPALDRAQGGLGIGLTLVRSLVEMHGGRVTAHSDGAGRGSTFEVRIARLVGAARDARPDADGNGKGERADRIPSRATTAPSPPSPNGKRTPVLLVEDQADARKALQRLLELWGHTVHAAADGHEAVRLAASVKPRIALVDIGLPGLDGYEVARSVRTELGDSVHLIALTGYGQPEDRERARAAGFDAHLVKPVDPKILERALAEPQKLAT